MTDFLIIGGVPVSVYEFSAKVVFRVGKSTRNANGGLRSDVRGTKTLWTGKTLLSRAAYDTLAALTANDTPVTVSGLAFAAGASILCQVRMDDMPYERDEADALGYQLNPTLTLEQV